MGIKSISREMDSVMAVAALAKPVRIRSRENVRTAVRKVFLGSPYIRAETVPVRINAGRMITCHGNHYRCIHSPAPEHAPDRKEAVNIILLRSTGDIV